MQIDRYFKHFFSKIGIFLPGYIVKMGCNFLFLKNKNKMIKLNGIKDISVAIKNDLDIFENLKTLKNILKERSFSLEVIYLKICSYLSLTTGTSLFIEDPNDIEVWGAWRCVET